MRAATIISSLSLLAGTAFACYESDNGKCTIGVEHFNNVVPGGNPGSGGGVNTHTQGSSVFIQGTNCVLTRNGVENPSGNSIVGYGNYGGISGGNWKVESYDPGANNIEWCIVSFTGRSDKYDETFDSRNVPEGVCDTYTSINFGSVTSGCRCRFDCI